MDELVVIKRDDLKILINEAVQEAFSKLKKPKREYKLMTTKDLCDFLDIHASTLNKWKKENRIPYKKLGKRVYYDSEDVINSLESFAPEKYNRLKLHSN